MAESYRQCSKEGALNSEETFAKFQYCLDTKQRICFPLGFCFPLGDPLNLGNMLNSPGVAVSVLYESLYFFLIHFFNYYGD